MGVLRFLLALVVVLFHNGSAATHLMDSHTAVKIFFMISGFYMALILDQKYGRIPGGIRAFAINRFLRLYPLYIVVLALTIGWYLTRLALIGNRTPLAGIFEMQGFLNLWQICMIWISNISLLGLDFICTWDWSPTEGLLYLQSSVASPDTHLTNLGSAVWVIQAWSVSMEVLFYLCAPFLFRLKSMSLAGVIITSLALDIWMSSGLGLVTYFFAPAQLYLFATGMMLYRAYSFFKLADQFAVGYSYLTLRLGMGFLLAWGMPFLLPQLPQYIQLVGFAVIIPSLFALTKDSDWDRMLGNLSYPIYLSHMLVGVILNVVFKHLAITGNLATGLMLITCILAAIILHRLVEIPIEGVRRAISLRLTSRS